MTKSKGELLLEEKDSVLEEENMMMKLFNFTIYKIIAIFVFLNLLAGFTLYMLHIDVQKETLFHSIIKKTTVIGASVEDLVDKTVHSGVPLKEIKGGQSYLDEKLKEAPELEYLCITNSNGEIIASSSSFPDVLKSTLMQFAQTADASRESYKPFKVFSFFNIPIPVIMEKNDDERLGYIHVGISNRSIQDNVNSILFDIAVIVIVSLVVGFEFLRFTFLNYVIQPVQDFLSSIRRLSRGDFTQITPLRADISFYECIKKLNDFTKMIAKRFSDLLNLRKNVHETHALKEIIDDKTKEFKVRYDVLKTGSCDVSPMSPAVENIRIVLFLILLSESIITPIMPSYAMQFYSDSFPIGIQAFATLPVLVYMIFSLISMSYSIRIIDAIGLHRSILLASILTVIGYIIALAPLDSITYIILGRIVCAIGYGVFYSTAQTYLGTYSSPQQRVQAYAMFTIAAGAGNIAGMPVGGILVDNLGYMYTFLISAILTSASIFYIKKYVVDYPGFPPMKRSNILTHPLSVLKLPQSLDSIRMPIVYLLCPARTIFVALLYIFYPLYLASIGESFSAIGRVMMLCGILMFLMSNIIHLIIKRVKNLKNLSFLCTLLIGLSMGILNQYPSVWGVSLALVIFTAAYSLNHSSIMEIMEQTFRKMDSKVTRIEIIAIFSIFDRLSMIFGPLIMWIVLSFMDFRDAPIVLGVCVLAPSFLYVFWLGPRLAKRERKAREAEALAHKEVS